MVIWRRNENFGFLKKKKNYTQTYYVFFFLIPGVGYGLLGHDLPRDLVGVGE